MNRQARDHEVCVYFRADDYARVITWADVQDRSIANFIEHAVRRYLEFLEEQDSSDALAIPVPLYVDLRRTSDENPGTG